MDRGLLSEASLLDASRDFVCVRLLTYEDQAEGEFLKTVGGAKRRRAGGAVLNTTFVMLAPDGTTPLSEAGRSPQQLFRGEPDETLSQLLDRMKEIVEEFPGNEAPRHGRLPYLADVRRALNVASCDNQPLVVVSVKDPQKLVRAETALARLAWSQEFRGRFAYARSRGEQELEAVSGAPTSDSVFVIQPGMYGLEGTVLEATKRFDEKGLSSLLQGGLEGYEIRDKDNRAIRAGKRLGVEWEAEALESRTPHPEETRRLRRNSRGRRGGPSEDG